MIEFLNYVPAEGSIGEFVPILAKFASLCLFLWIVSIIKKITERD